MDFLLFWRKKWPWVILPEWRFAGGLLAFPIMLFADDTLLFFEASRAQAESVKIALDLYGSATGQSLNYNKCSVFFGSACPTVVQDRSNLAYGPQSRWRSLGFHRYLYCIIMSAMSRFSRIFLLFSHWDGQAEQRLYTTLWQCLWSAGRLYLRPGSSPYKATISSHVLTLILMHKII